MFNLKRVLFALIAALILFLSVNYLVNIFSVKNKPMSDSSENIIINGNELPKLKVETVEEGNEVKNYINKVETKGLFRGTVLNYPIASILISDENVQIDGLIYGKKYSNLVLVLEYMDENKKYILEDFIFSKSDEISKYISEIYKKALNREITEEEFNEWYYKLKAEKDKFDFIKNIVLSEEFTNKNRDVKSFINNSYNIIFNKKITNEQFNYWKEKYESYNGESIEKVRKYLIDNMIEEAKK